MPLDHPLTAERLLGIQDITGDSRLYLPSMIEGGLSVGSIDALALSVNLEDASFKYRIVAKATLDRRKKSGSRKLSIEEGDRLARLAKAFSFAIEIYKGTEGAKAFMTAPHPMLDGRSPMDVALKTGAGADAVIQLLGRAAYGGGV